MSSASSGGSAQPASLLSLFVFNPTLGSEDSESRKLLYFYPPSTSMNAQKDIVGIIEGLSSFSRELSGARALESVRSDEQLYGLLECEPDWWLAASIRHPAVSSSVKGKTGEKKLEFAVDDVDDAAVQSLLRSCYSSFRLFNGGLAAAAAQQPLDVLRARLELFFRFYLPTVRFSSLSSFSLSGFQFLFVDKACFLSIQYLLNLVRCSLPAVVHSCCLYDGKLIYTSIAGDDMLALYQLHEPQRIAALASYLAINEELTMRVDEAAAAAAAGGGAAGNSNGTSEGGEGDVFVIPQSLYEAMAVRGYSGEGASESRRADFLSELNGDGGRKADKGKDAAKAKQRRKDNAATTPDKGAGVEAAGAAAGGKSGGPPVGFLTGPYRSPLPASVLPSSSGAWSQLNSPMWTQPLPITLADRACVNSPRVFLSQQPEQRDGQHDERKEAAAAAAAPVADGAAGPSSPPSPPLHRLVMYQRESISLCFIVASDASQSTNNAPPLSFYDQLESLLHARNSIKKLAAVLAASAASLAAASASSPSSQPAPAASGFFPSSQQQSVLSSPSLSSPATSSSSASAEPYRFLYYNAMNLAVKCTFDPSSVTAEALRVMRDMHNAWSRKGGRAAADGSCESVVRLRSAGWVVGRKALQSHREFFLLLDDKTAPTLAEVQREMQQLVHSYLTNAFIGA